MNDLIERLRTSAVEMEEDADLVLWRNEFTEAADRIESLTARVAELESRISNATQQMQMRPLADFDDQAWINRVARELSEAPETRE